MDRTVRIAVVGLADSGLARDLATLPTAPVVQPLESLYGDAESLHRMQPDVVFLAGKAIAPEDVGGLRMLGQMLPNMGIVLVGPLDCEIALQALAQRLTARILLAPWTGADLAAVLDHALLGSNRPGEEVFLDLARGIADEINNPLLHVQGYLQLLASSLAPDDRDRGDPLASARAGVQRIQGTIDKMRLLSRAASGLRRATAVSLPEVLLAVTGARGRGLPPPRIDGPAPRPIHADPELLEHGLAALVDLAAELGELGCAGSLSLTDLATATRLDLRLQGPHLVGWQLPRTFEPYYLSRVSRGTSHGLSLFLVQTIVHAHRGQATACRETADTLRISLFLPHAGT
jgi:signal transduction histidine kinase